MVSEKKVLPISELKVGMISANDIKVKGQLLLSKDNEITKAALEKLKKTYVIDKVEVYLNSKRTGANSFASKNTEELEHTLNEFSSNLEDIFNTITKIKIQGMEDLRNFSKKIQEEFKATGMVIRNIVSYGSKSDNIYRHSVNVAAISFILGKWLGLNENEINLLTYSAILHDFGKTKLDEKIMNKKTSLTNAEFETYKTHPVIGYHFVKEIPYIDSSVSLGVLMHHERIDGTGYPLAIPDEKIHKFAKIIAIADLLDNTCSGRFGKESVGPLEALKVIQQESLSGHLDSKFCDMFLNHIINYYMGENVLLSDDRTCKIIQVDINNITKPLLLSDDGFLDLKEEKEIYVRNLII